MDLNADVGERPGAEGIAADVAILAGVSSVSVACGFHAGDGETMRALCEAAVRHRKRIGAHVSFLDREGFGRRDLDVEPEVLRDQIAQQLTALEATAVNAGGRVTYVKPHGALYHRAAVDPVCADAIAGRVPAMARIMEQGVYVNDVVAAFPSVTPVCAATITTGVGPDRHLIPSMNWYHRDEGRYVEYGSSFQASRQFGVVRSLTDTIYRMNAEHLSADVETVFETLDDRGVRTAGTTYLIYRGRHEHEVAHESALARLVTSTLFRRPVMAPHEFFYADLYASRRTGCRGALGMPGVRDQHTGCVGSYMVRNDLCDFMLFSLPDNDAFSHRHGPQAQLTSLPAADRQLERLMHAAGGPDRFLEEYAVIVTSDHSHALVAERVRLDLALADFRVAMPNGGRGAEPELALSPSQRAAMIYVLEPEARERLLGRVIAVVAELAGVDLVMWLDGDEAVIRAAGGAELHFAPGDTVEDLHGRRWDLDGELGVLAARIEDGRLLTPDYPDALDRVWSALRCATAGDVLLSAAPGFEFVDWGGADHVGGGSHGSLHRSDSLGALMWCGTGPETRAARPQWSLRDIAPMIRGHFS